MTYNIGRQTSVSESVSVPAPRERPPTADARSDTSCQRRSRRADQHHMVLGRIHGAGISVGISTSACRATSVRACISGFRRNSD